MGKIDRSKIIQLIHIAKSQIGLSDEDYRAVLESTAKKTSCSEMTLFELNEVLKAMKKLGFKVKKLETREEEIGWMRARLRWTTSKECGSVSPVTSRTGLCISSSRELQGQTIHAL